jgi:serine/threonine protein kinase
LEKTHLKINLDELHFTTKISEGAGGVVYKGTWYHQTVAIKKLKVADEQSFVREVSVLNRLRHPNVLELYGYCVDSKGYQYIITEFMDKGSLDNIMYNNGVRNFEHKIKALLDISHGMRFLHERQIMHRDLKPQNVLVNKDNVCKLCDFGLAKVMNETLTVGVIGTWQYMAPEIMNESETYNEKCDVYSFGIMMHEIFTLSKPYITSSSEYVNLLTMSLKILNGHRPSIPTDLLSNEFKEEAASQIKEYFFKTNELSKAVTNSNIDIVHIVKMYFELCTSCWSKNPSERPMFEQIITKLEDIRNLLHNKTDVFDDK